MWMWLAIGLAVVVWTIICYQSGYGAGKGVAQNNNTYWLTERLQNHLKESGNRVDLAIDRLHRAAYRFEEISNGEKTDEDDTKEGPCLYCGTFYAGKSTTEREQGNRYGGGGSAVRLCCVCTAFESLLESTSYSNMANMDGVR